MRKKPAKSPKTKAKADPRDAVLRALLSQVPFDGWTDTAYAAALKQAKIDRAEADKYFPNSIADCVDYFGTSTDETMQSKIKANQGFQRLRVRDKVTFGVRTRLEILRPHREAMRRLMIWYARPQHMPKGAKRFYKTVDLIWQAAGDTSTDYNFYTKRVLLSAVLKATILFWLNDDSDDGQPTWDFLDRRIGDVMKLGKSLSLLKEFKPSELIDLVRDKVKKAV